MVNGSVCSAASATLEPFIFPVPPLEGQDFCRRCA
nr:MAG TPA: hypothetical protein [Caudoviricetes sp.]